MSPEWRAMASTLPLIAPVARLRCIMSSASIACSNQRMKAINGTPGIEAIPRYLLSQDRWAKRPRQQGRRSRLAGQLQADLDYTVITFPPAAGVISRHAVAADRSSVDVRHFGGRGHQGADAPARQARRHQDAEVA